MRNEEELLGIIRAGARNRATNATIMNKISSRSHAVLQIVLEERRVEGSVGAKKAFIGLRLTVS